MVNKDVYNIYSTTTEWKIPCSIRWSNRFESILIDFPHHYVVHVSLT